jgi:hypothetical protein
MLIILYFGWIYSINTLCSLTLHCSLWNFTHYWRFEPPITTYHHNEISSTSVTTTNIWRLLIWSIRFCVWLTMLVGHCWLSLLFILISIKNILICMRFEFYAWTLNLVLHLLRLFIYLCWMNRFNIEVDIILESVIWSIPILWSLHLRRSLVRRRSFFPFHQRTTCILNKVIKYCQRLVLKNLSIIIVLVRVMDYEFF